MEHWHHVGNRVPVIIKLLVQWFFADSRRSQASISTCWIPFWKKWT